MIKGEDVSQFLNISWEQFHLNTLSLVQKLKPHNFNRIIAVSRGGLVPASIMASELDIKYVDTICLSSYKDKNQQVDFKYIKEPDSLVKCFPTDWWNDTSWIDGKEPKILIIEDIVDTGKTVKFIKKEESWLEGAFFTSVYTKPQGKKNINQYSIEVSQDTWVEFPWEKIGVISG